MGVVPLPPPSWMTRDELIEYRDYLERQRVSLPFSGSRSDFPSETFQILLWALLPWILTLVVKIRMGDWSL